MQQRVPRADQPVEARLFQADLGQEHLALVARQHRDLGLDLGRDRDGGSALFRGALFDRAGIRVAGRCGGFVHVADIEHRHGGQQAERVKQLLFLRLALDKTRRFAVAQQRQRAVDEIECFLRFLVLASDPLLKRVDAALEAIEISQHQLGLDRLDIGDRIDRVADMRHVRIVEAAHHVRDRVDLADVAEELVAEPLAFGRAFHEPCDIHEGEPRRHDLGGLRKLGQHVETRIRHRDLADIRLDGAERIVRSLRRRRFGQRIEERRLADIRQSDDAAFEAHAVTRSDREMVGKVRLERTEDGQVVQLLAMLHVFAHEDAATGKQRRPEQHAVPERIADRVLQTPRFPSHVVAERRGA